ncbi:amidohydrolase [Ignatzschineria sp. LJL83]
MAVTLAEKIYMNGTIFTSDAENTIAEAIAFAGGKVLEVGSNEAILKLQHAESDVIDLEGKMLMPGIVDSHLHPFWGGLQLSGCNLDYASLTVPDTLKFVQNYLDQDTKHGENDWLQVRAFLRQEVLPLGTDITRRDLDTLNTKRPVILFSNDCHTLVANSRALELFGIDENTLVPPDGTIRRYPDGTLNGIMEDAPAMRAFDSIPVLDAKSAVVVAEDVQKLLNSQGVTTVMDARALPLQFDAFTTLKEEDRLTIRLLGAREITPDNAPTVADVPPAVEKMMEFAQKYSDASWQTKPGIFIQHAKFFVDGVMQSPINTASLLQPYRKNIGTKDAPNWQPSDNYGYLYYPNELLTALISEVSAKGFHPHMHTVADGAIEVTLNAIETMREKLPGKDIRPSLAHNELTAPHQYKRFKDLGAIPCLSFQWAGYSREFADELLNIVGKERFDHLEPAGKFYDAGIRVAFGSDWPIDPLNEWYDFKVALTRIGDVGYPRLNTDRNVTLTEVLRSATIDAAYMIAADEYVGSLEAGKFADYIILDRDLFKGAPEDIENVNIKKTFIGGKEVYSQD